MIKFGFRHVFRAERIGLRRAEVLGDRVAYRSVLPAGRGDQELV